MFLSFDVWRRITSAKYKIFLYKRSEKAFNPTKCYCYSEKIFILLAISTKFISIPMVFIVINNCAKQPQCISSTFSLSLSKVCAICSLQQGGERVALSGEAVV